MHTRALDTFVPMLESLTEWLDRGVAHASSNDRSLADARLAPDMYTLAQQVQLACHHATDAVARLTGNAPATMEGPDTTLAGAKAQIDRTLARRRDVSPADFDGADERDCSIPIGNGMAIVMDGLSFLRACALPHFHFHAVTAYDILRHEGVGLGKQDYLSQVGACIRPQTTSPR